MAIETILTSCSPAKASPPSKQKRRPSALSLSTTTTSSITKSILSPLKQTFSPISQKFSPLKETFDEIVKAVTDLPSQIEDTYHDIIQTFNDHLFSEKRPVPCFKVSKSDFHETASTRHGRALVLKQDLDFERLMVESDRRGSHDSRRSRTSSLSSSPYCGPNSESPVSWIDDGDSDVDVMSLTSPGLSSPDSSPRSSLTFEGSSTSENRECETRTSTSNDTLLTEESDERSTSCKTVVTEDHDSDVATKVSESLSDDADGEEGKDKMTARKVVRIQVRQEIPRIWKLEKPLPQTPIEIAPGILAV